MGVKGHWGVFRGVRVTTGDTGQDDGLGVFTEELFAPMARTDQRAKARLYVRGLLTGEGRKSMLTMAERLHVDYQSLQQFMTSSTWDVAAVRERLARRAVDVVSPIAWALGTTEFVKDGVESACVARQYAPGAGRPLNCQLAVTVHMVSAAASAVANWRLFIPAEWDLVATPAETTRRRRRRCRVPDDQRYRPQWMLALEMLDELAGWGLRPPLVVAGPGFGDVTDFRSAMVARGWPYLVQVNGKTMVNGQRPRGLPVDLSVVGRWLTAAGDRTRRDFAVLKDRFGLNHFEGRTWIGWNRHVTLASTAYLFDTARRAVVA